MLIIVDDCSGTLSDSLLASLSLAIGAVRPVGTTFSLQPPQVIAVQVGLAVEFPAQFSISSAQAALQAAIGLYINQRPIGSTLSITRISQLAYQTEPAIINISNVTINGGSVDLIAQPTASFIFQTIVFS
jgi:hypothetical protein